MSIKENASPIGSTMEEAIEDNIIESVDSSNIYNNTVESRSASFFSEILGHGEDHAITGSGICSLLGISDRRKMYSLIRTARRRGELILASDKGYFLPSDDPSQARKEIEAFVALYTSRAKDVFVTSKPFRLALRHIEGQFHIPEVEHGKEEKR